MIQGSAALPLSAGSGATVGVSVGSALGVSLGVALAVGAGVSVEVGVGVAGAVTVNPYRPEMGCPSLETTFHSTVIGPDVRARERLRHAGALDGGVAVPERVPQHPSPAARSRPRRSRAHR